MVMAENILSRITSKWETGNRTDFERYVDQFDDNVLEILGFPTESPLDFLRRYLRDDLEHLTKDYNANVGNRKSTTNRASELAKPWLKFVDFEELFDDGRRYFGEDYNLDPIFHGLAYMHDSTKLDRPYCIGVSAMDIMLEGRPYADVRGIPPKHFTAFMGQVVEYIMNLSGEFAGAVAVSDWIPCMAYYVDKERIPMKSGDLYNKLYKLVGDNWEEFQRLVTKHSLVSVEQSWQHAVHIVHNKYRADGDPPYTNISINSPAVVADMFDNYVFPDGSKVLDHLDTIMKIQQVIAEFMYRGDPSKGGVQYRFPVITANFKPSDVGTPWWNYIMGLNHKGVFNICHAEMFSSCCRLLSDWKQMAKFKFYSNGSGGLKIGSHRVITQNLPGIAHTVEDKTNMLKHFRKLMDDTIEWSAKTLYSHKHGMLGRRFDIGYNKFFSHFIDQIGRPIKKNDILIGPWLHPNMLFSTGGVHGAPDVVYLLGEDVMEDRGMRLGEWLMAHIVHEFNKYGTMFNKPAWTKDGIYMAFNVEQVPAESASYVMASFFGDKQYSNQFVPLEEECSIWDRVRVEGRLSKQLTGGSMTFLSLNKMMSPEQSVKFHRAVMEKSDYSINQFCVSHGWTVCSECSPKYQNDEEFVGIHEYCPKCGKHETIHHEERVVGYMVPHLNINTPRLQLDVKKRHRSKITW